MMEKLKTYIIIALSVIVLFFSFKSCNRSYKANTSDLSHEKTEVVVRHHTDTIYINKPELKYITKVKDKIVYIKVNDSIQKQIDENCPEYIYNDDIVYITGKGTIDSLIVLNKRTDSIITKTITETKIINKGTYLSTGIDTQQHINIGVNRVYKSINFGANVNNVGTIGINFGIKL